MGDGAKRVSGRRAQRSRQPSRDPDRVEHEPVRESRIRDPFSRAPTIRSRRSIARCQDPNGLLAAGDDLSPERLLDAYAHGIFPWFGEDDPVLWWSPDPRMVLFTAEVHVSRSLRKTIRSGGCASRCDSCFTEVMDGCAAPRPGQDGTWITDEMTEAYVRLFELGYAHSVEAWDGRHAGRRVCTASASGGCSTASRCSVECPMRRRSRWWRSSDRSSDGASRCVDCQMSTGHLSSLGAREIPRAAFLRHVRSLVRQPGVPSPWRFDADVLRTLVPGSPL